MERAAAAAEGESGDAAAARAGPRGRDGRREVQVSRALSRLLRHQAEAAGVGLDGEGFAPLDRVLAWGPLKALGVSVAEVQSIVATNDKQRYTLKAREPPPQPGPDAASSSSAAAAAGSADNAAAAFLIRANQGHSIKLASAALLEPITLAAGNVPPRVLHGTYFAFWPAIVAAGGLRPMGRNHVHCATGLPAAAAAEGDEEEEGGGGNGPVVSGMRRDAELVVEIDVEASLRGGLAWWRSANGVILTEGAPQDGGLVSARFFKSVTGRRRDVGLLWEDGRKVADLPAGLAAGPPPGKGPRRGGGDGARRGGGGRHQRGRRGRMAG